MKQFFTILSCIFFLSSCATVFTGTKDIIYFESNPNGAVVYIDGKEICKTPCRANIKRSVNEVEAFLKLDGYETKIFTLDQDFNVVSVVNLGFVLGWGIDALSGAIHKYDKTHYSIDLIKDTRNSDNTPFKIDIDTKEKTMGFYVKK